MLKEQKPRGRPMASRNVKITPEFREEIDIEKLGRALIAAAMNIAEKKKAAEAAESSGGDEGAGMT